jgi:hypothetical protein
MITEEQQKEILSRCLQEDGSLFNLGWYVAWSPDRKDATLDGSFTADHLEAIANHMRAHYRA